MQPAIAQYPRGYAFEELSVDMSGSFAKVVTDAEIVAFGEVTGDENPLHLDDDFARRSFFKQRIAHGFLVGSFISTVIGTKMPGPGTVYLEQNLRFTAPVGIGDQVTATVSVQELLPAHRRVVLKTVCTVDDKLVIDGEALVYLPPQPRGV